MLHFAANAGANQVIKVLVSLGKFNVNSGINATNNSDLGATTIKRASRTPIILAARNGHTDTVKLLVKLGADPQDCSYSKSTPLHLAATTGNYPLAKYLVVTKKV